MTLLRRLALAGLMMTATALADDVDEADEAGAPDLDFLEYLGSWQESDEDWLWVIEWDPDTDDAIDTADPDAAGDPENDPGIDPEDEVQ